MWMLKGNTPLRVVAADDSPVMRTVLKMMFELHARDADSSWPQMELCEVAEDGTEALAAVERQSPDVLLLDVEMPRLDGLGVLRTLKAQGITVPVILCSAYTESGARTTLDALALGAKDYVMKPGQQLDFAAAMTHLMEQLIPKIAALGSKRRALALENVGSGSGTILRDLRLKHAEVVVIAVSTGGPSALEVLLPALPSDFPVPILIVQHMPKLFTGALAERLDKLCRLRVREAQSGEPVRRGTIWLAPGDAHMEIDNGAGPSIRLHRGIALNQCMPSADYLFNSAARVYGPSTLAVVMTGMGSDGLDGARAIEAAGGTVLAQDEATSAVWGMPARVVDAGLAHQAVPLGSLARIVCERVQGARPLVRSDEDSKSRDEEAGHGMF
jgi:two-component system chemotaxis response regulator CheB